MEIPADPTAIFLSHGGGPLPILGDPGHVEMVDHLQALAHAIRKPRAIIVVSAHWEEADIAVTAHPAPPMIYDYYGFPEESYSLDYPAPGNPGLAAVIAARLEENKIDARLDADRGFDHGLYIPLMIMFPEADIPCIQVSLHRSLDPLTHIRIGEALAGLATDGALLIGSGFSFHNLKVLLRSDSKAPDADNAAFEAWLGATCSNQDIDEEVRTRLLVDWSSAPAARYCHPREEHLLPLHVCYGAVKRASLAVHALTIMGKKASTVIW